MTEKTLILFTGPSTVGKTAFVEMLRKIDPNLYPMPQVSCRQPRADDDPALIRVYPDRDVFERQSFWIRHKDYGLLEDDLVAFLASDKPMAIGMVGIHELQEAKDKKQTDVAVKTVLVRFAKDPQEEVKIVEENIKNFFAKPKVRLEQNRRHLEEFFLNDTFIKKYVDLVLYREDALQDRFHIFGEVFNHPLAERVSAQGVEKVFSELQGRKKQ